MSHSINVNSEIGRLKKVMLHRPGKELENLMPDYLERLLFDDIPYLEAAQKEHDEFAKLLESLGVEVLYLEKLVAEAIDAEGLKEQFVDEWMAETGLEPGQNYDQVKQYLMDMEDTYEMVLKTMEGFKKSEIKHESNGFDELLSNYPFLVDPMPNLYFTRDPFATMGNGVSLNHMYSDTRNRETLYGKYIFNYHPEYKGTTLYYERDEDTRIEGGDELVLSKNTLAVGISQRTDKYSIEKLARNLFKETEFKEVLAFLIDNNRKFMHLDTVFTMIDYDKFTIHPEIEGELKVFSVTPGENGEIKVTEKEGLLEDILAEALGLEKVTLIRCGGDDIVAGAREQWNDGANTLTVAPGEVIVYNRNTVTNKLLIENGIKIHQIEGSELVRGRGGPRCMSMPFVREDI
ncbi:arginine deiminase [Facklamia sp. P12945]|uniref:arginine deiminase n=1 Tax=unclassified Facklamia TaxID=2622293 RepID=UPI003D17D53E